jgi:hypothetical protein
MNQRELEREIRREKKEAQERYERLCASQDAEQKRRGEELRERERQINWANQEPDFCCLLSELEPDVWASDVRGEVQSAITFAVLLGVEVEPASQVYDFIENVFVAWNKLGRPLFNPISRKFSPHTITVKMERKTKGGPLEPSARAARKYFKEAFVLLEPITGYFKPLSEFINDVPALNSQSELIEKAPRTIPDAASFGLHDEASKTESPVTFSAQIAPYAHEN